MSGPPPSPWPTVDLGSRLASEITGVTGMSVALSDFGAEGASTCGSAIGCGTSFRAASRGWEKLAGGIFPGGTAPRPPLLVHFHILMAKAMGMRMQPWEAG